MAINKNHEFEDLDGVKCAVVEKNVSPERAEFLRNLLSFNQYKVVVVASPPPKTAAPAAPATGAEMPAESAPPPPPVTFTVGVTDVMFNATNAIFGRLLKTPDGRVVTLAFWKQQETVSHDEIPYYERR
ncbi:MAG: hypothetical protein KGO92_03995 [Bacteroidota bacterium]|nr:hypothetical protein [Bacteroidota bacterium]